VDLTLLTPANEKVPGERSRSTASGFHAGPDCPEDESCRGQNKEYVFFDGLEPPKGHYTVDIALAKPHEGDGILDGPVKVRFGARLGARVVGFDVELSPGQDVGKTFSFDVP
jgi:hypothetical protein